MKNWLLTIAMFMGVAQFGVIIALWVAIGTSAWINIFYTWCVMAALFVILYILLMRGEKK